MEIRLTQQQDIDGLRRVLAKTDLFPSDLLPQMVLPFLTGAAPDDLWLTCSKEGGAVGFCYVASERMAEGTWNMLALAVHPDAQRRGYGAAIVADLEGRLRQRHGRILIVETSGADHYAQARAFYAQNGYKQEARIRDFWAAGEDKIVFWKML